MERLRSGSTGASPVVVGALADHIFAFSPLPIELKEAVGEGADCNSRGAYAPRNQASLLMDWSLAALGAEFWLEKRDCLNRRNFLWCSILDINRASAGHTIA